MKTQEKIYEKIHNKNLGEIKIAANIEKSVVTPNCNIAVIALVI